MKSIERDRPQPRKAPKQSRSLETVSAIVEAAARILEEEGHNSFSTNAIALRAGVSIGSLYQYFPTKDAIIGALLVRETTLLLQDAAQALSKPTGEAALSALISAALAHQFRRPRLARLLDFEEARLPSDSSTQMVGEGVTDIAHQVLSRLNLSRQLNKETAAADVIAIMKGMIDAAGARGESDLKSLAKRVNRAVFGYLGL